MRSRIVSDGGCTTHGMSRRRPFHSLSSRHMALPIQAKPDSMNVIRSVGNFSNRPSPITLVSCDDQRFNSPACSSKNHEGKPVGVGGPSE